MEEPKHPASDTEAQQPTEMFQARDHTTIAGFPSYTSSPSSVSSRFSNALGSSKAKLLLICGLLALSLLLWTVFRDSTSVDSLPAWTASPRASYTQYLSQSNYLKYSADSTSYRVAIISDMDTNSAIDSSLVFKAEVKEGRLTRKNGKYTLEWDLTVRRYFTKWTSTALIKSQ